MPLTTGKIKRSLGRFLALAAGAVLTLLSGCGGGSGSPELPPTPILRIRSRWAVVKAAYVRVKADPSSAAADTGYLRGGAVVEVFAREYGREVTDDEKGFWLGVRTADGSGWVYSGYLDLYDRKEQALKASAASK